MGGNTEGSWSFSSSSPPKSPSYSLASTNGGNWFSHMSQECIYESGQSSSCPFSTVNELILERTRIVSHTCELIPHPSTMTFHSSLGRNSFSFYIICSQTIIQRKEKSTPTIKLQKPIFQQGKISFHQQRPLMWSRKKKISALSLSYL